MRMHLCGCWQTDSDRTDPSFHLYFRDGRRHLNPHATLLPTTTPTGSFARASTTSLGSICFGSLIVAVLEAMKVRFWCLFFILKYLGVIDREGHIVRKRRPNNPKYHKSNPTQPNRPSSRRRASRRTTRSSAWWTALSPASTTSPST